MGNLRIASLNSYGEGANRTKRTGRVVAKDLVWAYVLLRVEGGMTASRRVWAYV